MVLTGENRSTRRKTLSHCYLFTANSTWTDLGSNPGLQGERSATNGFIAMDRFTWLRLSTGLGMWKSEGHETLQGSSGPTIL